MTISQVIDQLAADVAKMERIAQSGFNSYCESHARDAKLLSVVLEYLRTAQADEKSAALQHAEDALTELASAVRADNYNATCRALHYADAVLGTVEPEPAEVESDESLADVPF